MKTLSDLGEGLRWLARRSRTLVALTLPVAIPLFVAAIRVQPELDTTSLAASAPTPATVRAPLDPWVESENSRITTIQKNDTLDKLLVLGGLSRNESAALLKQLQGTLDVRKLQPGNLVRFQYSPKGAVDSVHLKLNGFVSVSAFRTVNGFDISTQQTKLRSIEQIVSARIDTSLYEALRLAGESPQLVQQIVDVFQWDIDFFQLRKGDELSLIVDKQFAGSELAGYGPIRAARFVHRGTKFEAFLHEGKDGASDYYTANGTPLRKEFLKAPLRFSRVTSGFTNKRFHPILGYFRPHHGVDYGAPTGTPVMSTAAGVVVEARFSNSEGNIIRVRHSSRYDTCYLHLSRFAKGLKKGTRVRQGEVIGYVGSTGLATGPHLDYRVSEYGSWINPITLRSVAAEPLRGPSLAQFRASVDTLSPRLINPASTPASAENLKRQPLF